MSNRLVIVESPAKARTIAGFLGSGYVVESSIGHVRDLPRSASEVPEKYKTDKKSKEMARLGVDVENGFKPIYVIDADKKKHIAHLKQLLKDADELLLATDEDREGESIAWHLLEVLAPKVPVKRMVFHEITKKAIAHAIDTPREVNRDLVDAQEARRILDRLYGYEVSPVLWKKVMPRLSAGRVQSVATRVVVDRERARMAFRRASYWGLTGTFATNEGANLEAELRKIDGRRLATGKDFDSQGQLGKGELLVLGEADAKALATDLEDRPFNVASVETKPYKRTPSAPFMTSTLQQEAGRKLRFGAQRTMRAAQRLYEGGFITYMRTDSTTLSESAISAARKLIESEYGPDYLPASPRVYTKKVKNAQEAHEAIRPAGDSFRHPSEVARRVEHDQAQLYELIWKRTVASQMADARGQSMQVRIEGKGRSGRKVELAVSGNAITFPGFLRAYVEGSDDPNAELETREKHLPPLTQGQGLSADQFKAEGHETQPPARFTEASLVRQLEELGVGRPSTYASILSTIVDRGYVWKKGTALVPSFKAFAVVRLLEEHFGRLVDYAFTARMEDDLDTIANGEMQSTPWLHEFYFGKPEGAKSEPQDAGLKATVASNLERIDAREINSLPIGEDEEGRLVVVRVGRYGPYLMRGEETAPIPDGLPPDELTLQKAVELLAEPSGDRVLGKDPETDLDVIVKTGRFGAYVQLGEIEKGSSEKPKRGSLLQGMSVESITLEEALRILSLPREVGVDPTDGESVTVNNGRYGPYVQKGKEIRSLEGESQLFTLTLQEGLALLAQPKRRGGRAQPAVLRELGDDPVSGQKISLRKGRFGPYVTDGETNASLRTGDDPDTLTDERAQELLQLRRERGPSKKAAKKKAPAKKAAKKKAPAKKAAAKKKAPAKKAAAKKKAPAKKAAAKKKAPAKKAAKGDSDEAGSGSASSRKGAASGKDTANKEPPIGSDSLA